MGAISCFFSSFGGRLPLMKYLKLASKLLFIASLALCIWSFATLSLPTESSHILVVAPQNSLASDNNPGIETQPFQTINAAARRAQPGDKIVVHDRFYC